MLDAKLYFIASLMLRSCWTVFYKIYLLISAVLTSPSFWKCGIETWWALRALWGSRISRGHGALQDGTEAALSARAAVSCDTVLSGNEVLLEIFYHAPLA